MKLFDAKALFLEKWERSSGEYVDIAMKENASVMKVDVASRLLNVVYLVFVVCMAAAGLLGGSLTLGQFAAALNAVSGMDRHRMRSPGDSSRTGTPPMVTLPDVGSYRPQSSFTTVDFPAPFSPTKAVLSPSLI